MVIPPERVELAKKIARGFVRRMPRSVERDDLEAAAMVGLFKALRKQPDGAGDAFEHFVRMRIRGAILDELRRQDWLPRRARRERGLVLVHLEDVRHDGHPLELVSDGESPETAAIRAVDAAAVWRSDMPERDERVLRQCFGFGQRERLHADVAASEGVSPARISQVLAHRLDVLREEFR